MNAASQPFEVILGSSKSMPILISSPHSGTLFPPGTATHIHPHLVARPPDTDWFVDKLYDFAPDLGITMIRATYSRYVIDLNRDPKGFALYSDGRSETHLVPLSTFGGEKIYIGTEPTKADVESRLELYYWPYYRKIESLLKELLSQHKQVLFYDAHSIRHHVESIQKEPFPGLILGNQDGKTAGAPVIDAALTQLKTGPYQVSHNHPFKGGHLTRYFGRPHQRIHALQLEMSQTVYMDEEKINYLPEKAESIRRVLKATLIAAAKVVGALP